MASKLPPLPPKPSSGGGQKRSPRDEEPAAAPPIPSRAGKKSESKEATNTRFGVTVLLDVLLRHSCYTSPRSSVTAAVAPKRSSNAGATTNVSPRAPADSGDGSGRLKRRTLSLGKVVTGALRPKQQATESDIATNTLLELLANSAVIVKHVSQLVDAADVTPFVEALHQIAARSNCAGNVLRELLELEFARRAKDPNTIMREASVCTKFLAAYTKAESSVYLKVENGGDGGGACSSKRLKTSAICVIAFC
jgi:hypothetical protein